MFLIGLLIGAGAVTAGASSASANPIALAEKGELQCYRPDVEKKTCQSIAAYRRTGPDTYDNKALLAVGHDATLETHTPVLIRGDAVCGYITAHDLLSGTLRVGGRVLAPAQAKSTLERIAQGLAPLADKEICTRYVPSGTYLMAKGSIAGSYQPALDVTVKWIDPADGYTVTP